MLKASPKGTVPVLVLPDGEVIDQSVDIMRYALTRHDPERWLSGDDPELIALNDGSFKHNLDRYIYPERYGSDALHNRRRISVLEELERMLSRNSILIGGKWG